MTRIAKAIAKTVLAGACAAATIATAALPAGAIINGGDVSETGGGHFVARVTTKWEFESQFLADSTGLCTGSLIHPEWVLTAAHCMQLQNDVFASMRLPGEDRAEPRDVTVQFGTQLNNMETRTVRQVIVHPGYTTHPSDGNDLALLQLKTAADRPRIKLGVPEDARYWGTGPDGIATDGEVFGWGRTVADDANSSPTTMQKTMMQIRPDSSQALGFLAGATEIYLGDKNGRSTCKGDSGGPLLVSTPNHPSPRLVGVSSHGEEGCTGRKVHMEVGAGPLQDWIRSEIPDLDDPEVSNSRYDASISEYEHVIDYVDPEGHRYEESDASGNVADLVRGEVQSQNVARRAAVNRDAPMNMYLVESEGRLGCYQGFHDPINGINYQAALPDGFADLRQVFAADGAVYAIRPNGDLVWRRHDGRSDCSADWSEAKVIGTGWNMFDKLFAMETGVAGHVAIYGAKPNGDLHWYLHRCARTGGGVGTAGCWSGGHRVSFLYNHYKAVFAGGHGVIYTVDPDGTLRWRSHDGYRDGANVWTAARQVGHGWHTFTQLFSGTNDGDIYAVTDEGLLYEYRHYGFARGTGLETAGSWGDRELIGSGWYGPAFAMTSD